MAAVFALIMLPLVASVGCLLGITHSEGSIASALAAATFVALAGGVFLGALRVARDAEGPSH